MVGRTDWFSGRKAQDSLIRVLALIVAGRIFGVGREPLGQALDFAQHAPLHHQRAGFHREHCDARRERSETEAVSADQPRPPAPVHEHESPDPVPVLGSPGKCASRLDQFEAHTV